MFGAVQIDPSFSFTGLIHKQSTYQYFTSKETRAQEADEVHQIRQGEEADEGFHPGQPDAALPQVGSPAYTCILVLGASLSTRLLT